MKFNVFYSTFTNVFLFLSRFLTFLNVFLILSVFYIYGFNLFCRNTEISSVQSTFFRVDGWELIRRQTVVDGVYKRLKVVLDKTVTGTELCMSVSAITPTTHFPEYHIYRKQICGIQKSYANRGSVHRYNKKTVCLVATKSTLTIHSINTIAYMGIYFNLRAVKWCTWLIFPAQLP